MSQELKTETIVPQGSTITLQMYPKAEVDAVLAEKDAEIAERKEKYNELAKLHDKAIQACCDADKVIAHQKYKRCLAMAKWSAAECVVNQYWYKSYSTHKSEFMIGHLRKWRKRWLELAEKFKEAK